MSVPSNILQVLSQLLAAKAPERAARLKQRLNAALSDNNAPPFDERKYGYKGFRDFLQRGTEGLLVVEESADQPDLLVSLPGKEVPPGDAADASFAHRFVRPDVWQAFTNPDPRRKRFLNRKTHAVRHYIDGESSAIVDEVAASDDFIEIVPITGVQQQQWMAEFFAGTTISADRRAALEALLAKPYSSGLNAMFTGALLEDAPQWRAFRSKKGGAVIAEWAKAHGVPVAALLKQSSTNAEAPTAAPSPKPVGRGEANVGSLTSREKCQRLLEMISDDDISHIVLPFLASTLLVRSKD